MIIALAIVFLLMTIVWAVLGTFTWDPNTEPDLAGYRLYQSDVSGQYTYGEGNEIACAPVGIEAVVYDIPCGTDWYFVLTAYDETGNESGPSNEVTAYRECPDTTPPQDPNGLQCFIQTTGG